MTEGHEVWTQQAGWTSACQLSVGDAFIDAAGEPVEIVEIVFDPTPTTVYNLEVDGAFTYFAEGVWVHNDSCTFTARALVEWHHLLPLQWKHRFERVGLQVEEFRMPLEREFHRRIHGKGGRLVDSWNGRWKVSGISIRRTASNPPHARCSTTTPHS